MDSVRSWYARHGKRLFDLVAACLLLIPLAPVLAGLAALVWWWHGGGCDSAAIDHRQAYDH